MHTDCLDPKPKGSSMEAMRENDWLIQRRRGMYMTLVTWYDPSLFIAEKGLLPLANLWQGYQHGRDSRPALCRGFSSRNGLQAD